MGCPPGRSSRTASRQGRHVSCKCAGYSSRYRARQVVRRLIPGHWRRLRMPVTIAFLEQALVRTIADAEVAERLLDGVGLCALAGIAVIALGDASLSPAGRLEVGRSAEPYFDLRNHQGPLFPLHDLAPHLPKPPSPLPNH